MTVGTGQRLNMALETIPKSKTTSKRLKRRVLNEIKYTLGQHAGAQRLFRIGTLIEHGAGSIGRETYLDLFTAPVCLAVRDGGHGTVERYLLV